MSWTNKIIKSGEQKVLQPRLVVVGVIGVGKSSFGASLPDPIFIDFDRNGVDYIRVDRLDGPKTWPESLGLVREIASSPGKYKSLVIDTMDPLEEQATEFVLKEAGKTSLAQFDFGAGYNQVAMLWKELLSELDAARRNGMLVCLIGHSTVRDVIDPTIGSYQQNTSVLGKKPWALTTRWADFVGFATYDSALVQAKGEENRVFVSGKRVLYTSRASGVEAKNRFAMEPKIELSWKVVEAAIARHRQSSIEVREKIQKLAAGTAYEQKAAGYLAEAGDDLQKLLVIETNLTKALGGGEVAQAQLGKGDEVASADGVVTKEAQATSGRAPGNGASVATKEAQAVPGTTPKTATKDAQAMPGKAAESGNGGAPASPDADTIRGRIYGLAHGTTYEDPAKMHMHTAGDDLVKLLQVEEALKKKIQQDSDEPR